MTTNHSRRLRLLEMSVKPAACPECRGYPARLAYIDPATDKEWLADMPASGCPECGRPPFVEHHIYIEPFEGATPDNML